MDKPQLEESKPIKVPTCSAAGCGYEVPHARALDQITNGQPIICQECEEKGERGTIKSTQPSPYKKKTEFSTGNCTAIAKQYGIPTELSNLFFMTLNDGLYIKNPGLLYLASKRGYSRIEITSEYNTQTKEWESECKIYPKITREVIEGIGKLDPAMQKTAWEFITNPTNGTGRASEASVKMATMHVFLKEMSQTRAQNRALRAFTGYGGCSYEETEQATIERE